MRTRPRVRTLLPALALTAAALAQGPPANGPAPADSDWQALLHGTVVVRPGERILDATLVLRNGRVVSVAAGAPAPAGAREVDCRGLTLYPGLVEPFLPIDVPAPRPDGPLAHWHPMVLPQRSALDGGGPTADDRRQLRELGFGAAAIAPKGGVCAGSAAVVLLDEPDAQHKPAVVRERAYALCSLHTNPGGPTSEMGAIALLRQVLSDADWYARCRAVIAAHPALAAGGPEPSAALEALAGQAGLPLWFDVDDELEVLRAAKVAHEAGRQAVVLGSGMEFRRLPAVAATGLPIVVPVRFPEVPDVGTVAKAERVSLRQLQSWEQAPTDLARLLQAGVKVALTTARLERKQDFRARLAEAMACGVQADAALAALTTQPAALLGVGDQLGTLEPGRFANVVAVAGDLFDPKARIRAVWVAGRRHEVESAASEPLQGRWAVTFATSPAVAAEFALAGDKLMATFGERKVEAKGVTIDGTRLDCLLTDDSLGRGGASWCRAHLEGDDLVGELRAPDGATFALRGTRAGDAPPANGKAEPKLPPPALGALPLPLGGYGLATPPARETAVFRGATLWTETGDGIVPDGALFVRDGKIAYAGPAAGLGPVPPGTRVIDCAGKHITPGLIDCHSHTGISRGVNESGQAVTAEVRVQDVVDPDDVNWYRELAGGVTTVNQLHGSANAIGGQSNTVKLVWGCAHPDDMEFQGAPPGIKFALGENPRRANSRGDNDRYPNTRMGVEALLRDRFLAAADYARRAAAWLALPPEQRAAALPPRRDLELEALAEVLAGKRRVHCHSYRQDEISMLCGLAKEFGFRIGTFQHVLEGYKVADAIRDAAIGASTFSDWWGYKFEAYDAIPENGAIMHDAGVCVSFNSDSDELARRLNTEAGKAVKYGGLQPAEALAFVTRNPAQQLGIDDRVGSLARGKDADFAVWSGDPLSYASVCEATWVDGAPMFTRERDRELREAGARERQRLLQRALAAGRQPGRKGGGEHDALWAGEDADGGYSCHAAEAGGRR